MTTTLLTESVTEAPVPVGTRWLVAIATPGQGSSGFYSEDMLAEHGPKAFPAGAKMFMDHKSDRSPKDMLGVFPDGAYWDAERKQLMGEVEVFSHWRDFVNEVGPSCGVSIYMMGESDKKGNVTKLVEDRMNGADLVSYPGLVGSGLAEMLESARSQSPLTPGAASVQETDWKDATNMEEVLKALAAVNDRLDAIVAEKNATEAQVAQVEADSKLAEERVDAFEAAVEAIEAADLTVSQKRVLRAEAKKGADVAPMIEAAKALKAEIVAEAAPAPQKGFVHEAGSGASAPLIEGWGV